MSFISVVTDNFQEPFMKSF